MNQEHADQIAANLPTDALVIDVGGGAAAFARADWVIDALPLEERGKLLQGVERDRACRFTDATWVQRDLCDPDPWPFDDIEKMEMWQR